MALSWNEIKDRALNFSKEWESETSENAEAKSFWDDFFQVFGLSRRRVATFEQRVTKSDRKGGFIDMLWKGQLLVEHKSAGKDLNMAYQQAIDYFPGLKDHELPKYICVCNFQNFRLIDLDEGIEHEFDLNDLVDNVQHFGFIAGYKKRTYKDEDPVNIEAAYLMGKLHDALKEIGYTGHALEVYLVRILFCLFAEDTSIFEKDLFRFFIEEKTKEDGSDLGAQLAQLFQVLNTAKENRLKALDEALDAFPYVNGSLFVEFLPIASFNTKMRETILECSALDWTQISPAIFGSLFQSVMNPEERRNLGAHYTSEKNILKLIKPLFLDELHEEFEKVKGSKQKLREFHKKLSTLKFLDPACGCGNFLVITYRELRDLEIKIIKELYKDVFIGSLGTQLSSNIDDISWINIDQFYGIEIEEWPARISEVAMWLMDHQMNMKLSEAFGQYFIRLPLRRSAKIVNANALRIDWNEVVSKDEVNYILGNPPFMGHHLQTTEQKNDLKTVLNDIKAAGVMDYVSGWFYKAAKFINDSIIKVAFVSTNSISQGEQVNILWKNLLDVYKLKIHFAHRTFRWNNEAKGVAAVHVVIIGFGNYDIKNKRLFEYENIQGEPLEKHVKNINPYLLDIPDILIFNRSNPICDVPAMKYGSKPSDGGHFLLSNEEKEDLLRKEPQAEKVIRPFISAREFLRNINRWCIWLVNISPKELSKMPEIMKRVELVKIFRSKSKAALTRDYPYHTLFRQITQPLEDYIIVPRTTSERRNYIPLGFFSNNNIVSDTCQSIANANIFHFGILTSEMHMAWVKYTCGRLKSDYRYSKDIVYNNYPWPSEPSDKQVENVKEKAQKVLDTRERYPDSSLADLYDPLAMPPDLLKAHKELDRAVDLCYRRQPFPNESARLEFLFALYQKYTAGLFKEEKKSKKSKLK